MSNNESKEKIVARVSATGGTEVQEGEQVGAGQVLGYDKLKEGPIRSRTCGTVSNIKFDSKQHELVITIEIAGNSK